MNRRSFLSGIVIGAISGWEVEAGTALDSAWAPHSRILEQQIPDLMRVSMVPALSIAVFKEGQIIWLRAFGVRDQASNLPATTDTLFEAASMSKPLFAYVVLKLCEIGTLNLDVPLTHYTRHRLLDDPRLDLITARHILSHTSGLVPDWRSPDQPLRIAWKPGEKWSYSGEGYYYLQSVITELTGRVDPSRCDAFEAGLKVCATDFGEYMESQLTGPLGLRSSGYVWKESLQHRRARPHDRKGKPLKFRRSSAIDLARYGAAGGLFTTPGDYAKFLMEIMAPQSEDRFHLSTASIDKMLMPQIEVVKEGDTTVYWGLGWRVAETHRGICFGHGGENPGFQCMSEACRSDRSGFVVMTNGDNGAKLVEKIVPEISKRVHS